MRDTSLADYCKLSEQLHGLSKKLDECTAGEQQALGLAARQAQEKAPAPENAQSAPEAKRHRHQWGLSLDAPAAVDRAFLPRGWTQTGNGPEATGVFGHSEAAIDRIFFQQSEHLARKLKFVGLSVATDHAGAKACRTVDESAEKQLVAYRDRPYPSKEAPGALPNAEGVVLRGIDCLLDPESYAELPGISSVSESQQVAGSFLTVGTDRKLIGTMFIMQAKTGREVDQLSAFTEEGNVEEAAKMDNVSDLKAAKKGILPGPEIVQDVQA